MFRDILATKTRSKALPTYDYGVPFGCVEESPPVMDILILGIFAFVYLGMILGKLPGLALDRTGIALLGAIALMASGRVDARDAWMSVDVPTIGLLLGLMVVSAQFRLGGFYAFVTRKLGAMRVATGTLLALLVLISGTLSAVLANDIVCLAMAPVLVEACAGRRLNPVPFLLALACASNVGSAVTLIGNPQNMLIGQSLGLSFGGYSADAWVPVLLSLAAVWSVIFFIYRRRWEKVTKVPEVEVPPFDLYQTCKGALILLGVVWLFLAGSLPREIVALSAAGVLLTGRRLASRRFLALVDWPLLVLFIGLFVVNRALESSGLTAEAITALQGYGIALEHPGVLFGAAAILSNIVSNVPAVMLLLPAASHSMSGLVLGLASTFAGNLLIVGSIANIIVVDQAERMNIRISWAEHARVGIPVTLISLGFAGLWLWGLAVFHG